MFVKFVETLKLLNLDINIVTEHSLWWVLAFILVSVLLVFWLYFYKKPYHKDISLPKIILLSILRGTSFFCLLFFLLGPKLKYSTKRIEKPILVFAQDNSQSIRIGKDSLQYLNDYPKEIEAFIESVNSEFTVHQLSFGNKVEELKRFDYKDTNTDFSQLIEYLKSTYGYSTNVQVLLASDGIYNKGSNPNYLLDDLNFPIHSLQLGDTATIEDLAIYSIRSNKLGFINSKLPVRIELKAQNFNNELIQLKISRGGKTLVSDQFKINSNSFFVEKDYFISPDKTGLQRFKVDVFVGKEEQLKENNHHEFVVDILDNKQNVAICFDQYHPDISALKSAIDDNLNYTCETINLAKKKVDLEKYNLIILYQIPSNLNSYSGLIEQMKEKEIPLLLVLGGSSNLNAINSNQLGVNLENSDGLFSESFFKIADNFNLFTLKEAEQKILEELPPLLSPIVNCKFNSENQIFGEQVIKSVETENPQIAFSNVGNQKIAWIFGEGLWRWKLHTYRINNSTESFSSIINSMIQYLALKVKRSQLRLNYPRNIGEGEELVIDAEYYNESYQLVNDANLEFLLKDSQGKTFNYQFDQHLDRYRLQLNSLSKGSYSFVVKSKGLDPELEREGNFIVSPNNNEARDLQAQVKTLAQISKITEGKIFNQDEIPQIASHLLNNEYSKSTMSEETKYLKLVELLYLLIFIIIVMILEWFLRKYWLGN